MEKITIETSQHVTVEYELASIGDRILATLIDGVVMFVWYMAVWMFMLFAADNMFDSGSIASVYIVLAIAMLPPMFYHLLSEIFMNGQSIGKKARDTKVIRIDGTSPSVGDYLLRWLLRLIDIGLFSGVVAVVTIAINGRGQRLGDIAAGTTVVRIKKRAMSAANLMPQTDYDESYQVQYPQVEILSDQDIALAKELLFKAQRLQNPALLYALSERIKEVTGITTSEPDRMFLEKVIKDYNYLTSQ